MNYKTCDAYRFCDHGGLGRSPSCHRYPPVSVYAEADPDGVTSFPDVELDDWCGE